MLGSFFYCYLLLTTFMVLVAIWEVWAVVWDAYRDQNDILDERLD